MKHNRVLSIATTSSLLAALVITMANSAPMPEGADLAGMLLPQRRIDAAASDARARRRLYEEVQDQCQVRTDKDPETVCPSIDDLDGIRRFLGGETLGDDDGHMAAPDLTTLPLYERRLLRRYQRIGTCPVTLLTVMPGLYDLCLSLVGERDQSSTIRGLLNEKAVPRRVHTGAPEEPTILDRIRAFEKPRPDR